MGFLDKAKEAADRAMAATQQAAQQGQAKIASVQSSRSEAELLRALGEAFYAEQRRGGDRTAVLDALTALDQHHASAAAAAAATPAPYPATGPIAPPMTETAGGPAPTSPATPPSAAPAAGNFTLDDF